MITIADELWPVLTISRNGPFTMADATALLIACDNVLRRREPFAVSLVYDEPVDSSERDAGADGFIARWLRANDTLWREWCRGCAVIGAVPKSSEPFVASLAEIGCPMATFTDQKSGEIWLSRRVEESSSRENAC